MVHICNFCLGKVFHNNVFLMFSRFGDDITIYVLYDGISDNCSCRGPSIKDVRTLGGEGGQEKAEKCGHGKGVVSQMWKSAWKKIIATIFVKFTQINEIFCIFVWPIMPVCHIYFVVNPIFWNAIIEIV